MVEPEPVLRTGSGQIVPAPQHCSCLTFLVSRLLSHVSCLMSPVSRVQHVLLQAHKEFAQNPKHPADNETKLQIKITTSLSVMLRLCTLNLVILTEKNVALATLKSLVLRKSLFQLKKISFEVLPIQRKSLMQEHDIQCVKAQILDQRQKKLLLYHSQGSGHLFRFS